MKASEIKEQFKVSAKGIVDILMIIDDSDSMQNVHAKLKALAGNNNLQLLKGIEDSSWQLALADARPGGCLRAAVTKSNLADYLKTLQDIEAVKELDHHERALFKMRSVFDLEVDACDGPLGSDWLRNKSTLAVIIVTDEDHQCSYKNSPGNTGDGNTYWCEGAKVVAGMFKKLQTSGKISWGKIYGIMDKTNNCGSMRNDTSIDASIRQCYASNADMSKCNFTNPCASRNDDYKFRSANFAAAGYDIKDMYRSDYAGIFSDIVKDIKAVLQDRFYLQAKPKITSLTVKIGGSAVAKSDYDVDVENRILQFKANRLKTLVDTAKNNGVSDPQIEIAYSKKDSEEFKDTFSIDSKADMQTVVFSINGVEKTKDSDYSISGNSIELIGTRSEKEILFPEQAKATVQYRHQLQEYPDLVLQQPNIVEASVKVYVDDVATNEFTLGTTTVEQADSNGNKVNVDMPTIVFNTNHWPQHEQNCKNYLYLLHHPPKSSPMMTT